jgi:hypothetical protein
MAVEIAKMPIGVPFAASPRREPDRARRIPESVKAACLMMIEEGLDFIAAAKANGLKPDSMRRYLNAPQVVAFIRKERARFRASVCSANEYVLQEIRDNGENTMARVRAVQVLEQLDEVSTMRRTGEQVSPGICIVIHQRPQSESPTVDVTAPRPTTPQIVDTDADER